MADRNLKLLAGYAAWREYRWHAHKRQIQDELNPPPVAPNAAFVAAGIVGLLLAIPWLALFAGTPAFGIALIMNLMWDGVAILCIYAGIKGR